MGIYLIRHTTPDVEKGICYGQADLEVKPDLYPEEFTQVVKQIPDDFQQVWCSPLKRCHQLARDIASHFGFDGTFKVDPRLKELNFGKWELSPWDKIHPKSLEIWMEDFVQTPTPNGESFRMMYDRVLDVYLEIEKEANGNVLVVTHSGVIRSILSYLQKSPLHKAFDFKVAYGAVLPLEY